MRVAVEMSLSVGGYRVVTADHAEEGLCAIVAEQPELVIAQAEWPDEETKGETIIALLRAVRAGRSNLPFLILAQADYEMSDEVFGSDLVEHVCVPWDEKRLRSMVAYLLDKRSSSPREIADPTESEIEEALLHARGIVSKAARHLGLTPDALYRLIRKVRPPD